MSKEKMVSIPYRIHATIKDKYPFDMNDLQVSIPYRIHATTVKTSFHRHLFYYYSRFWGKFKQKVR